MERILKRLDEHLNKNDYDAAERHLLFWLAEKRESSHAITLYNELMGIYRKMGQREKALDAVNNALQTIKKLRLDETITAATTYLNAATVYHAFGEAERSLPLFERARNVYERELSPNDPRLGGLYNNTGTALVSLHRFAEANALYQRAIAVMKGVKDGDLEIAVTLLNMASAVEEERGTVDGEAEIAALLDEARALLEAHERKDGHYAFVLTKAAPVYRYFGYFRYAEALEKEGKRIYEGT